MKVVSAIFVLLAIFIGWLAWFPIRIWMFNQIPVDVAWAGIAKIAVVVLIGWCGGIALPVIMLIMALKALVESL